jgi:hypothetical protein
VPTQSELIAEAHRLLGLAAEMQKPITQADLASMSADEIVAARDAGKLDHLLRGEA